MGRKFEVAEDIIKRLHGTICLYKGRPVYVMYENSTTTTLVKIIPVEKYDRMAPASKMPWETIDYTQDTFRYKAFPLGYMNYGSEAYYLSRIPFRYQYYGLNPDCIHWEPRPQSLDYGVNHVLFSQNFVDMIERKYPTMDEAEVRLHSGWKSVAISPDVAIHRVKGRTLHLMFKGKNIGIKMGTQSFVLYDIPETKFLRKILPNHGVQV